MYFYKRPNPNIGPDGKPLVGPNGELLGIDGQPIRGPDGQYLGVDGSSIPVTTETDENISRRNNAVSQNMEEMINPVNTNDLNSTRSDSTNKNTFGPNGELLGPDKGSKILIKIIK